MSNKKIFVENFSIGVDIESISRFKKLDLIKDRNFLKKIFTEKELEYCFSKKEPAQHLAARFAAKEAVVKALGSLGEKLPSFNDIEIVNEKNGVPRIYLEGYDSKISLAHCEDKAIAFVVVKKQVVPRA